MANKNIIEARYGVKVEKQGKSFVAIANDSEVSTAKSIKELGQNLEIIREQRTAELATIKEECFLHYMDNAGLLRWNRQENEVANENVTIEIEGDFNFALKCGFELGSMRLYKKWINMNNVESVKQYEDKYSCQWVLRVSVKKETVQLINGLSVGEYWSKNTLF